MVKAFGLPNTRGALVNRRYEKLSRGESGLLRGDVIQSLTANPSNLPTGCRARCL